MRFILLAHFDENAWFKQTKAEQEAAVAAYSEYGAALTGAGALIGNYRSQPTSAAKRVRVVNGKREVEKVPFVEDAKQLGGVYIIEAPDLEAALMWAERSPAAADGYVEVRAVWG